MNKIVMKLKLQERDAEKVRSRPSESGHHSGFDGADRPAHLQSMIIIPLLFTVYLLYPKLQD